MRAVVYDRFEVPPQVLTVDDPACPSTGVVIEVAATGVCRSDWHGWMGHDRDIVLPHVPGHEFAGTVAAVGRDVEGWQVGDRVTVPFVCACGECATCLPGRAAGVRHQFQPGFTHWGSFAEFVAIDRAEVNVVRVPDAMSTSTPPRDSVAGSAPPTGRSPSMDGPQPATGSSCTVAGESGCQRS